MSGFFSSLVFLLVFRFTVQPLLSSPLLMLCLTKGITEVSFHSSQTSLYFQNVFICIICKYLVGLWIIHLLLIFIGFVVNLWRFRKFVLQLWETIVGSLHTFTTHLMVCMVLCLFIKQYAFAADKWFKGLTVCTFTGKWGNTSNKEYRIAKKYAIVVRLNIRKLFFCSGEFETNSLLYREQPFSLVGECRLKTLLIVQKIVQGVWPNQLSR